jgi:hypothetical protein
VAHARPFELALDLVLFAAVALAIAVVGVAGGAGFFG